MYFLCAFGNTTRISVKVATAREAALYCYGVVNRVTCVLIGSRSWKYLNNKTKAELQNHLRQLHKKLTGFDLV